MSMERQDRQPQDDPPRKGVEWVPGNVEGRQPKLRKDKLREGADAAPAASDEEVARRRPLGLRILFWILLKSIVPLLLLLSLVGGLYVGYAVIGDGPKGDVWEWSTWKHMYDLIFSES
ncbi:DNA-directed RNA polymerase subunit beta [Paenibacillus sp. IB182496]|uniref:DNA-directed RNA polymerase subunit beta n=1 Tax=Paenibacillus sabuli TaxID=2772509 RepID=A0A927BSA7_9BACL|nr:DNA-directed RNA polymerase subunit beta [Paenibacillus sabuli]MBD2845862.1 DNA-directed RNA polymerase subunit beta [Paenibacillus sabuli]